QIMKKAELKHFLTGVMLAIFLVTYSPYCLFAQTTLQGRVLDETGEPLPNASVQIKNGDGVALSNIDGTFSIVVPQGQTTIVVSFVGFVTQEVNIAGRSNITVTMQPQSTSLQDVVVIGYGTQRAEAVTGSVSSIQGDALREVPSANISQALQGRLPGVELSQTSSQPGAGMQIRIRGSRSLSASNDPLIVLDGIPFAGSIGDI